MTHGSGQACAKQRITPRCDECRAYGRERSKLEVRTPGTYAYNAVHGIGREGQLAQDRARMARRRERDAIDRQLQEELCRN